MWMFCEKALTPTRFLWPSIKIRRVMYLFQTHGATHVHSHPPPFGGDSIRPYSGATELRRGRADRDCKNRLVQYCGIARKYVRSHAKPPPPPLLQKSTPCITNFRVCHPYHTGCQNSSQVSCSRNSPLGKKTGCRKSC